MSKNLYGAVYKNNKFSLCYTDNNLLVVSDSRIRDLNTFVFNEYEFLSFKKFIDKSYEEYKKNKTK